MRFVQLVNLTPHAVILRPHPDGPELVIHPSGQVARIEPRAELVTYVDPAAHLKAVPVYEVEPGRVEGLPEPEYGVGYIVSAVVAQARPNRDDLLYPYNLIRDEEGRVVGARALARPRSFVRVITTRYLPATAHRGSRIVATCSGSRLVRPYDYVLGDGSHDATARALASQLGIPGPVRKAGEDALGYTFVVGY